MSKALDNRHKLRRSFFLSSNHLFLFLMLKCNDDNTQGSERKSVLETHPQETSNLGEILGSFFLPCSRLRAAQPLISLAIARRVMSQHLSQRIHKILFKPFPTDTQDLPVTLWLQFWKEKKRSLELHGDDGEDAFSILTVVPVLFYPPVA